MDESRRQTITKNRRSYLHVYLRTTNNPLFDKAPPGPRPIQDLANPDVLTRKPGKRLPRIKLPQGVYSISSPLVRNRNAAKQSLLFIALAVTVVSGIFWLSQHNRVRAVNLVTVVAPNAYVPNGDVTTGWTLTGGTSDGTCATGGTTHHCDREDEISSTSSPSPSTTDYVDTGTSGTTGEVEQYDMTSPVTIPSGGWVSNITLYMYAQTAACLGNATNCDSVSMNVVVGGTAQTASAKTLAVGYAWYNTSFNAPSGGWSQAQLDGFQAQFTRNRVGGGSAANADDDVYIAAVYAVVTYQYYPVPLLSMTGYTFENDDGANVNSDTIQSSSSFSSGQNLTGVSQGERLTLRAQLKNTGNGPLDSSNLGLFYDRGDGIWTKVRRATTPVTGNGTGCADAAWTCTAISTSGGNSYTSTAIDDTGSPWISYYNSGSGDLMVTHYVGTGGSGCAVSSWSCATIDNVAANTGQYTSIALDASGNPWISYYDVTNADLRVAHYVGTSGTGCAITSWTCTSVDSTGNVGMFTSVALDSSGNPWISYYDSTNLSLKAAHFVSTGGTGCAVTTWSCTTVDKDTLGGTTRGQYTSIAIDSSNAPWIVHYEPTNGRLWYAKYIGGTGGGCNDPAWDCTQLATGSAGYPSLAFDPSGNPWVSYYKNSTSDLNIARYVGSGGTGCTISVWNCTTVDNGGANAVGSDTSIAFDAGGNPWVSYFDSSAADLKVSRYMGGATSGTGCTLNTWTCSAIDTNNNVGNNTSIAFDPNGLPWISYFDSTNTGLRAANLSRTGEITMSAGRAGANGDSITSSHADMTTAGDSTNKADADCIGGGTWNNGKWFSSPEGAVSVPAGNSTAQCTEVAFTIDTSQAIAGTSYRFAVATKDNWRWDKGQWRGAASVSSYPQITIASSNTQRYAKDTLLALSACADTNWGCDVLDSTSGAGGNVSSLAFDSSGIPSLSYLNTSSSQLRFAQYVGSSGTGCGTSTAWTCTTPYTSSVAGKNSLAYNSSGTAYISFGASGALEVARSSPGSAASGSCAANWTCTVLDNTNSPGASSSIAIDSSGAPWISYQDSTNHFLRVARYVGSGGSGCVDSGWTCVTVDTADYGQNPSIAFDSSGIPWISYYDFTNVKLWVARYVGAGGTGCAIDSWTCVAVDTTHGGDQPSIAFDSSGNPWISYYNGTIGNHDLWVAQYVGSGGTGCAITAWTCIAVDTANGVGQYSSLAFDSAGNPWISHYDSTNGDLKVARYVGAGGTGCAVATWKCTTVDSTNQVGSNTAIAFDQTGTPWVGYFDFTNSNLRITNLNLPPNPLTATTLYAHPGRNAIRSDGRWHLDSGYTPRSTSTCAATTSYLGYCGISANDGNYDQISGGNVTEVYNFAYQNNSPSSIPTVTWYGKSSISVGSVIQGIFLQAYNFSTKQWETLSSISSGTNCSTSNCSFVLAVPKAGEQSFYENINNNYWIYFRVYQSVTGSTTGSLLTDQFNTTFENTGTRLYLGKKFLNGAKSAY